MIPRPAQCARCSALRRRAAESPGRGCRRHIGRGMPNCCRHSSGAAGDGEEVNAAAQRNFECRQAAGDFFRGRRRAVKRLLPRGTKIGHAGTLDPFATGVLLLLIGRGTKQAERLMSEAKQYECTVKFGATTETDDLDSPEMPWPGAAGHARANRAAALAAFVGAVSQQPPVYHALKIGGRPAYTLARAANRRNSTADSANRCHRIARIRVADGASGSIARRRHVHARITRDLGQR